MEHSVLARACYSYTPFCAGLRQESLLLFCLPHSGFTTRSSIFYDILIRLMTALFASGDSFDEVAERLGLSALDTGTIVCLPEERRLHVRPARVKALKYR